MTGMRVPVGGVSARQRREFAERGYLVVPRALAEAECAGVEAAVDRVYGEEAAAGRLRGDGSLHLMRFLGRDEVFVELLDLPTVFPIVWGLLGWNIQMYHQHLDVHPPVAPGAPFWGWHQDGGRQNLEIETEPRPMLSVKVGYVLSDLSLTGRGATKVIPGSHGRSRLARSPGSAEPGGCVEIIANPGDALVFDRRLWHSRSLNTSTVTRKVVFYAYTYRWIRMRDDQGIAHEGAWWHSLSPVRRQLLGAGSDPMSYWGLGDDIWPLRDELAAQGLLDPAIPAHR